MTTPQKPTVPEVLPKVREYYTRPGNSCGGNLHIVLDDGNVDDHNVEFCRSQAQQAGDAEGVALAELLSRMSKTQRLRLHRER